MSLSHKIMW